MKKKLIVVIAMIVAVSSILGLSACSKSEKPALRLEFPLGESIISNVAGSNSIFKGGPVLVIDDAKALETVSTQTAMIRDILLTIFRGKDKDYISDLDAMENLKAEIIDTLNERFSFSPPHIVDVYFVDFVMQ